MFFNVVCFFVTPAPERIFLCFGRNQFTLRYNTWWVKQKDTIVAWHFNELKRLDRDFALEQAGIEVVKARQEAIKRGIGPMSREYPDIFDFIDSPFGRKK